MTSRNDTEPYAACPLVINIRGPVLVFGGGIVGLRKAASLLSLGCDVRVVTKEESAVPQGVTLVTAEVDGSTFTDFLRPPPALVVCAFDDSALNHRIAEYCKEQSILVTNASDGSDGSVAFPNVISGHGMLLAMYGGGSCPLCSYALKRLMERRAPWALPFAALIGRIKDDSRFEKRLLDLMYGDDHLLAILSEGDLDAAEAYVRGEYLDR